MLKRKRVVLSLKDKINIIDSLKNGETGRYLAVKYGVGASTISDIKKNADTILKYTCKLDSEDGSVHRKNMKKPKNEVLEDALYCWYLQKRSSGQPISGPLLCEKALQLNRKMGGDESFVASNGWLHRFRSRHGIRELQAADIKARWHKIRNFHNNSMTRRRRYVKRKLASTTHEELNGDDDDEEMSCIKPDWNQEDNSTEDKDPLSSTDVNMYKESIDPQSTGSSSSFSPIIPSVKTEASPVNEKNWLKNGNTKVEHVDLDELDNFFLSMSKVVKRLPKSDRIRIKMDLHKAVCEAELRMEGSSL